MRILFLYSKDIKLDDIAVCLKKAGHEVDTLDLNFSFDISEKDKEDKLYSVLSSTRYDFVITCNYLSTVSDGCNRANVKYVSWTYDSPDLLLYTKSVLNPVNYIFLFDKKQTEYIKKLGVEHVYYLPLGVNSERVNKVIDSMTEQDYKEYGADISFLGSLYDKNNYRQFEANLNQEIKAYYEDIFARAVELDNETLMNATPKELCDLYDDYFGEENIKNQLMIDGVLFYSQYYITHEAAARQRQAMLNMVKAPGRDVRLYTYHTDKKIRGVSINGPLSYLTDMNKLFKASKINLNYTIPSIETGIPLRIYDCLAAGGFMITNHQKDIDDVFEIDKDLVVFDSLKELKDKVNYYLEHDEERRVIAEHGHATVMKYHDYQVKLGIICDIVAGK